MAEAVLPKRIYSNVIQGLKKMHKSWLEDRAENPHVVPYEIDSCLKMLIERCMNEGRMVTHGRENRERIVLATMSYLVEKGLIVKSPYGGHFFPLPDDTVLPSKEQLISNVKKRLGF